MEEGRRQIAQSNFARIQPGSEAGTGRVSGKRVAATRRAGVMATIES